MPSSAGNRRVDGIRYPASRRPDWVDWRNARSTWTRNGSPSARSSLNDSSGSEPVHSIGRQLDLPANRFPAMLKAGTK
jgi:hypothetical protein